MNALYELSNGTLLAKPMREDYATDLEFFEAFHEFRRRIDSDTSAAAYGRPQILRRRQKS